MKILQENYKKNLKKLQPENFTDLYFLSKIIEPGDVLTASTHRRVRKKGTRGREGDKGEKVALTLTIKVNDVTFQESIVDKRLRIKGTIVEGPEEYVSLGSFHTINITIGKPVTIIKSKWLSYHISILEESQKHIAQNRICLIAIEKGVATVAVLEHIKLHIISKITKNIPGKIATQEARNKGLTEFFKEIVEVLKHQVPSDIEIIVIGGPGKIKIDFLEFLKNSAQFLNKKIYVEDVASGTSAGIEELSKRGIISKIANEFAFVKIQAIIDRFVKMLATEPTKVGYGINNLLEMAKLGAIEVILINDDLIRTNDKEIKEKIEQLFVLLKKTRVDYFLVDHDTDQGKQIQMFGGLIAILRYNANMENYVL